MLISKKIYCYSKSCYVIIKSHMESQIGNLEIVPSSQGCPILHLIIFNKITLIVIQDYLGGLIHLLTRIILFS